MVRVEPGEPGAHHDDVDLDFPLLAHGPPFVLRRS
jgi:hypothetical protein